MRPTRSPLVLIVLLLWAGVDDFCLPLTLATSPAQALSADDDEFCVSEAECALWRSVLALRELPPSPGSQSPTSHGPRSAPTLGTLAGAHASVSPGADLLYRLMSLRR
jgi:hypothetical protein